MSLYTVVEKRVNLKALLHADYIKQFSKKKKKSTTALEKILGLTDYNGFYRTKEFTAK